MRHLKELMLKKNKMKESVVPHKISLLIRQRPG